MLRIRNARLVLPDRIAAGGLDVDGGRIAAVLPGETPAGPGDLDAGGDYLAPGFVDLHVHGGAGADFMDGTPEAFEAVLGFHAAHGVTALAATSAAAPLAALVRMIQTAAEGRGAPRFPADVLGVHLEGPYLNPEQNGCHLKQHIRTPAPEEIDRLLEFGDVVRHITLAPEIDQGLQAARRLADRGVSVSAGHTLADEKVFREATGEGVRHATHLWSAMTGFHREGPWRIAGGIEWVLGDDSMTTEVIADLKHLPPTFLKIAWRAKGPDRLCLVSDAMRGAGMPRGGQYTFGPRDGTPVLIEDGVAMTLDRKWFASSITPLDGMVRNMVRAVGVPLAEAVRMASLTPARVLGAERRKGSLEAGKDADLLLLGDDLCVRRVWSRGREVA